MWSHDDFGFDLLCTVKTDFMSECNRISRPQADEFPSEVVERTVMGFGDFELVLRRNVRWTNTFKLSITLCLLLETALLRT